MHIQCNVWQHWLKHSTEIHVLFKGNWKVKLLFFLCQREIWILTLVNYFNLCKDRLQAWALTWGLQGMGKNKDSVNGHEVQNEPQKRNLGSLNIEPHSWSSANLVTWMATFVTPFLAKKMPYMYIVQGNIICNNKEFQNIVGIKGAFPTWEIHQA